MAVTPDSLVLQADLAALAALANSKTALAGRPYTFPAPDSVPNTMPAWVTELNRLWSNLQLVANTTDFAVPLSALPLNSTLRTFLLLYGTGYKNVIAFFADDGQSEHEQFKITGFSEYGAFYGLTGNPQTFPVTVPQTITFTVIVAGDTAITFPAGTSVSAYTTNRPGCVPPTYGYGSTDFPGMPSTLPDRQSAFVMPSATVVPPGTYHFSFTITQAEILNANYFTGGGQFSVPGFGGNVNYGIPTVLAADGLCTSPLKKFLLPANPAGLFESYIDKVSGAARVQLLRSLSSAPYDQYMRFVHYCLFFGEQIWGTKYVDLRQNATLSANNSTGAAGKPPKIWLPGAAYAANSTLVDGVGHLLTAPKAVAASTASKTWTNQNFSEQNYFGLLSFGLWSSEFQIQSATYPQLTDVWRGYCVGTSDNFWVCIQAGHTEGTLTLPVGPVGSTMTPGDGTVWIAGCFPVVSWAANTQFYRNQVVLDSAGGLHVAQNSGVSGPTRPAWLETDTTTDGEVYWSCNYAPLQNYLVSVPRYPYQRLNPDATLGPIRPAALPASTIGWWVERVYLHRLVLPSTRWKAHLAIAPNTFLLDANGNLQFSTAGGVTGGSAPSWATAIGALTADGSVRWVMAEVPVQVGCMRGGVFVPFTNPATGTINFQTGGASIQVWWPVLSTVPLVYIAQEEIELQATPFVAGGMGMQMPVRASALADLTAMLNLL